MQQYQRSLTLVKKLAFYFKQQHQQHTWVSLTQEGITVASRKTSIRCRCRGSCWCWPSNQWQRPSDQFEARSIARSLDLLSLMVERNRKSFQIASIQCQKNFGRFYASTFRPNQTNRSADSEWSRFVGKKQMASSASAFSTSESRRNDARLTHFWRRTFCVCGRDVVTSMLGIF